MKRKAVRRKRLDSIHLICWIVIPGVLAGFLAADALGVYPFTKENMIVIGICLAVVLLPFFSEIKVKDLSVKRSEWDKGDRR